MSPQWTRRCHRRSSLSRWRSNWLCCRHCSSPWGGNVTVIRKKFSKVLRKCLNTPVQSRNIFFLKYIKNILTPVLNLPFFCRPGSGLFVEGIVSLRMKIWSTRWERTSNFANQCLMFIAWIFLMFEPRTFYVQFVYVVGHRSDWPNPHSRDQPCKR